MTARDRIVVIALAALAVLGAVWLLAVSPEREQAAKLGAEVSAAHAQLTSADSELTDARTAQAGYASAYTALVNLGKAVPTGQEVPSLIYQLARASNRKQVEFSSIASGAAGSSGAGAPASSTAAATTAGFTQMPFTFVFSGSFFDLYNLFQQLNRFTLRTISGGLEVSGRLLTIQSVKLAPASTEHGPGGQLTGTITATAYVLPASQGLTGGATPSAPAGAAAPTPVARATSAATTPAVIGANR